MGFQSIDLGMCRGCLWEGDPRSVVNRPAGSAHGRRARPDLQPAGDRAAGMERDPGDRRVPRPLGRPDELGRGEGGRGDRTGCRCGSHPRRREVALDARCRTRGRQWLPRGLADAAARRPGFGRGLKRRTAPALLVGGTADPTWNGPLARRLSGDVVELKGVDHGFGERGDDPKHTLDNLKRVVKAVTTFAARSGAVLAAADERHLRRHHRHELDVGVERQAGHVDDRVARRARRPSSAPARRCRRPAARPCRHPLGHLGRGVADVDLAAGDVVLAAVERRRFASGR